MKDGTLVMQRLSRFSRALLARAKRPKVLGRLGRGLKKAHDDPATIRRPFNFDVKEYLVSNLFTGAIEKEA